MGFGVTGGAQRSLRGRVGRTVALTLAMLALTAGAAQGKVMVIGGKPYGVTPTPRAAMLGPALRRGGLLPSGQQGR